MKGMAALLGALGGVLLAFGLLSSTVALFQPATDLTWILGNLIVGGVLVASSVGMSLDALRERLSSGEGKRVGKYGTSAIVTAMLGLAILGMIGFLSTRYSVRWDWSEAGIHTLTEQTLGLLDRLDDDVEFTAFFLPLESPSARDLLDRYDHVGERVSVRYVDPNAVPGMVEDLKLDPEVLARGLVRISLPRRAVAPLTLSGSLR